MPQKTGPDNSVSAGKKPGVLQLVFSVFAAFVGIQSNRNHDTDDAHIEDVGFLPYIIVGIVMTVLFVVIVYGVVMLTLNLAGA